MSVLSIEAQVLLMASAATGARNHQRLAALLKVPLDWGALARLSEREKLLPVVWAGLRDHSAALPSEAAAMFEQRAAVTEFRLSLGESALNDALDAIAPERIPVMLLKGAALAATVYGSFANRPMGDLDLLVPATDATRAWTALCAAGWTRELEGGDAFHSVHHHLPGLLDPHGLNLVLEVHRALLPASGPFVLDEERLWADATTVRIGTHDVFVPSDAHQLLHLCIHFAWSHAMVEGTGRTTRDVATLSESGLVAWPVFLELTRAAHAESCAYWTLRLSERLGGARIPAHVLSALRPRRAASVLGALERAYIATGLMRNCPSVRLARLLWSAGIAPARAGHGSSRPWHVSDQFRTAFYLPDEQAVSARLLTQAAHVSDWLRFARLVLRGSATD